LTRRDTVLAGKVALQRLASLVRPGKRHVTVDEVLGNAAARNAVDQFHTLWYASAASTAVRWMGHPVLKSPFDLWNYQEILATSRPDVIIETGTHHGGSALFFADVTAIAGHPADVITIDFNPKLAYDPAPRRIRSIQGISTADATFAEVSALLATRPSRPSVMVVLDSDHSKANVLAELNLYSTLVTPGQWLVVEDTNVNGHPVLPEHGEGPYEAVTEFLASNPAFAPDPAGERFLLTHNPRGWLRRIGR